MNRLRRPIGPFLQGTITNIIMKNFSIIVAMDQDRGIGKDGQLVWHLPADMKHFKEVTTTASPGKRNAVIMGRKTWESIPEKFRPLPGRLNVVVTHNAAYPLPKDCSSAGDLTEAFDLIAQNDGIDQIFVIGGASIYAQAIRLSGCVRLYVTKISSSFDCDVYFPEKPLSFKKISQSPEFFENNCHFAFLEYQKNV